MTEESDTVEQVEELDIDELNKEAREYSQEYITELISAAKEYLPKTVWDHIHRRAVPKAGGKASGKSKRTAAAERAASADTASVIPEVAAQLEQAQAQQTQKADSENIEGAISTLLSSGHTITKSLGKDIVMKPFPNEHAGRIKDPGAFDQASFMRMNRNSDGKQYSVIMGKPKMTL